MIYTREKQWQFLEDELKAEVNDFDIKLNTSAAYLMDKGEVFTAQFLSFSDSGEMRVRFSTKRPIPRKGEYLYCMTLHKELRDYKNWGNRTYGDLVKDKTNFSEVICNWISPSDDPRFILAGFIGVDVEFADWISSAPMTVLVMGPNKPPFDYIAHLQSLIQCQNSISVSSVLDADYAPDSWKPTLLDGKRDISKFLLAQLSLNDSIILQGPPGTGKTYHISKLCAELMSQGYSVLVTALTNRALVEIAKKPFLQPYLDDRKIYKTKVTIDEEKEIPKLTTIKEVNPIKGSLVLSTFFITSGVASELAADEPFDYVIVDEASQALLPMIAAAKRLGKKTLFVGDVKQMPPVIQIKTSKIRENRYESLVEGLNSITQVALYPTYQLTETRRLTERGAKYTGLFYEDSLVSLADHKWIEAFNCFFLNRGGGPTLLKTDMKIGDLAAISAMDLTLAVVSAIHKEMKDKEIAVLTCMKETVRGLQKKINSNLKKSNLIIDTVARVQGLTTDICIYVVPNTHYLRSLDPRLFNVATSRARFQTIIIVDKEIFGYSRMNSQVKEYLCKLDAEFSFYLPYRSSEQIAYDSMISKIE